MKRERNRLKGQSGCGARLAQAVALGAMGWLIMKVVDNPRGRTGKLKRVLLSSNAAWTDIPSSDP